MNEYIEEMLNNFKKDTQEEINKEQKPIKVVNTDFIYSYEELNDLQKDIAKGIIGDWIRYENTKKKPLDKIPITKINIANRFEKDYELFEFKKGDGE